MCFNIEYSCHTITNIKHDWRLSLQLIRHEIFPEFRNFHDLRGHSRGNRRSDLIFMGGGGGGTIYSVCLLSVSNAGTTRHKSSLD